MTCAAWRAAAATFAAALALSALATAAGAEGASSGGTAIGHGKQLKGTKIWYAQGQASKPGGIAARVAPTPAQGVKVQWSVVCQKPNSSDPAIKIAATGKSGEKSLPGAGLVRFALPFPKPPTCVATVYATLARGGKLVLDLLET